jgi:CubicO group peptidase (beta-lactamase class C family)
MPSLIRLSGPYGYFLFLLSFVVLFLTLRATLAILRGSVSTPGAVQEQRNGLLFWGGVAAILGLLGQFDGSYRALSQILSASEISPDVVAEGFVISFVPTLFGLGILGFAVAAWGCLHILAGGRSLGGKTALIVFLVAPVLWWCSRDGPGPGPVSLDEGVWILAAGSDEFLWEFTWAADTLDCIVHDVAGKRKVSETPCLTAEFDGNRVVVSMDTGVRLEGNLQARRKRIKGHLLYPDGSRTEVALPWRSREASPGLRPMGSGQGSYVYAPPSSRDDGWPVASGEELGLDPGALEEMVESVAEGEAGVLHSLLVARHGQLTLEEYFHGYGPGDLHHLASCTKSIASLLVGIAIDRGAIEPSYAPLSAFFPEHRDILGAGWEGLTLEHLLTMSMALDWPARDARELHGTGPEFFRKVLARSVSGTPGQEWAYVSAEVNLIAGMLHQATGLHAEAFAAETLFGPLEIERWDWEGLKTEGYNLMDGSLRLLPRDLGKIGQMVLDGGVWRGRQVVSEGWVRTSTARHLSTGTGPEGYGYLWWTMELDGPDGEPVPAVVSNGWGSQFVAVFPTLDMVIVTTGGNEYNGKHLAVVESLERHLLSGLATDRS